MSNTFVSKNQAAIGTKSSKSQETPQSWAFANRKIFPFFIHAIIQKYFIKNNDGNISGKYKKKQVRLFWWGYMNNDNENEVENEI